MQARSMWMQGILLQAVRAGLKQQKATGTWSNAGIAQDREHANPGCLQNYNSFLFFPWHFLWTKSISHHVRAADILTDVGSEINLLINIILLITYLLWFFLKYQMLLCKHHSYLDRLSHTLPPPLSHLSSSCDALNACGCWPSLLPWMLGTAQLWSCDVEVELLGVTQKRNDATLRN